MDPLGSNKRYSLGFFKRAERRSRARFDFRLADTGQGKKTAISVRYGREANLLLPLRSSALPYALSNLPQMLLPLIPGSFSVGFCGRSATSDDMRIIDNDGFLFLTSE